MDTWIWVLCWTVYGIGVVLTPIVAGMIWRKNCHHDFLEEGAPLVFISVLWPLVAAFLLLIAAMLVVLLPVMFVGEIYAVLMDVGSIVARRKSGKGDCHV